jgi:hypothetical protein
VADITGMADIVRSRIVSKSAGLNGRDVFIECLRDV